MLSDEDQQSDSYLFSGQELCVLCFKFKNKSREANKKAKLQG